MKLTISVLGITVVLFATLLLGCKGDRKYVADCRDAATAMMSKYGEGWQTKEIHFNVADNHCYLNLEGVDASTTSSDERIYSAAEKVVDVDENRDVIGCASTHERGATERWLCVGPNGAITREQFLQLRNRYLER